MKTLFFLVLPFSFAICAQAKARTPEMLCCNDSQSCVAISFSEKALTLREGKSDASAGEWRISRVKYSTGCEARACADLELNNGSFFSIYWNGNQGSGDFWMAGNPRPVFYQSCTGALPAETP